MPRRSPRTSPRTTLPSGHDHPGGPHELGRNLLVDRAVIRAVVDLVADAAGPDDRLLEIAAGRGALTRPLARLGHRLRAVEIDPRQARALDAGTPDHVVVVAADARAVPLDAEVVVGNLPFGMTTVLLRRILAAHRWHTAVLLTQWEVARRRAGVGGATLLTASAWPWYEFALHDRVPARSFRPAPGVDGGIVVVRRRPRPLVEAPDAYRGLVRAVFTGRGHGLLEILPRAGLLSRRDTRTWLREQGLRATALPRDLSAEQWADLHVRVGR